MTCRKGRSFAFRVAAPLLAALCAIILSSNVVSASNISIVVSVVDLVFDGFQFDINAARLHPFSDGQFFFIVGPILFLLAVVSGREWWRTCEVDFQSLRMVGLLLS